MRCLSHELYLDYVVLESLMQNPRIKIILIHIVYIYIAYYIDANLYKDLLKAALVALTFGDSDHSIFLHF